ncbi:MAG: right-handed parallel beta-helix repeat-containing protein [Kiritimatiellae bacterium]|nr:right-handed parallel beta-helix repeat-containing protein [Kiritimatiellia bacterium]
MLRVNLIGIIGFVFVSIGCAIVRASDGSDVLPNGERFAFWEDETVYAREWHVDASSGDDANPGNVARPFRSVNRAAAAVRPGEKVIVHTGVYRETVDACCGGSDAKHMIEFEAAGDGPVTISGAEEWNVPFVPSEGFRQTSASIEAELFPSDPAVLFSSNRHAKVWCGKLPKGIFSGVNPFALMNTPSVGWCPFRKSVPSVCAKGVDTRTKYRSGLLRRGAVYRDGRRMRQALYPFELWDEAHPTEDLFWVEGDGVKIHFRLKGDVVPQDSRFEITARSQGFAPETPHSSWMRLKGIAFEKFANPLAPPQEGAVSFAYGHHWIVEDCEFREINTFAMDIGFKSHFTGRTGLRGFDLIRRNRFRACGVGAVCGVPALGEPMRSVLFEDNVVEGCGWLDATFNDEAHMFKCHFAKGCLVRRNVFRDLVHGGAVWLDKCVENNRITLNAIVNHRDYYSAVFLEATPYTNRIDRNLIFGAKTEIHESARFKSGGIMQGGRGVYLLDLDNAIIENNVIADAEGAGVSLIGETNRLVRGVKLDYRGSRMTGNVFGKCGGGEFAVDCPEGNVVSGNVTGAVVSVFGTEAKVASGGRDFRCDLSDRVSFETFMCDIAAEVAKRRGK